MYIYTSYFANIKNLPKNIVPIAVCRFVPKWYNGAVYKKLAPTVQMLEDYKETQDEKCFQERYTNNILRKLYVCTVLMDLQRIMLSQNAAAEGICLVCFEAPDKFCHRRLLTKWLNKYGYDCVEYACNK